LNGKKVEHITDPLRDKYDIVRGCKIVFTTVTPYNFAFALLAHFEPRLTQLYTAFEPDCEFCHNVEFEGERVMLLSKRQARRVGSKRTTLLVSLQSHSGCLTWQLLFEEQDDKSLQPSGAVLANLFYNASQAECFPDAKTSRTAGYGAWILRMMDVVHETLEVPFCTLYDDSTFLEPGNAYYRAKCSAPCLYAATHNGLSFYNAKGYIINRDGLDVDQCIAATNEQLQLAVDFWNEVEFKHPSYKQQRRDKSVQCKPGMDELCKAFPIERNLIKYYAYNKDAPKIILESPVDPTLAARFIRIYPHTNDIGKATKASRRIVRKSVAKNVVRRSTRKKRT